MKKKGDEKRKEKNEPHHSPANTKRPDDKLQAGDGLFHLFSESLDVGIAIHDNGIVIEANEMCARMFGYELSEIIGMHAQRLATPESWEIMKKHITSGYDQPYEAVGVKKDGSIIVCSMVGKPYEYQGRIRRIATFKDITDRKKIEDELKQSTENYRKFFEDHTTPGIIIDPETGNMINVNHAAARYYGWLREEMTNMNFGRIATRTQEEISSDIHKIIGNEQNRFTQIHRLADGSTRDVEVFSSLIIIKGMKFIHAMIYDISESKKVEKSLKASEDRYRLLAENVTDVIFTIDMNFNYTYASPSVQNLVGYTADELITMRVDQLVDSETLNWFAEMFAAEMEIEELPNKDLKRSRVLQYQHLRKDGSKVWVENKITFLRDDHNNAVGIIGTVRDITDRKQEEKIFRSVTEQSSDIIIIANQKGVISYENPAIEKILGYKAEERIGTSGFSLVHPDDLKIVNDAARILFHDVNASAQTGEIRLRHKDGSWRTFEVTASNLVKDNAVEGAIINLHDITERKQAEEILRKSEEQYRLLADHMKDQVWIMDLNLKITYVSPSVEKLLGYTFEELKELPLEGLLTAESLKRAMDFFNEELPVAMAAPPDYVLTRAVELQFCCKDGQTVWGESMFSFIRDENGRPVSILGEGRNITERKQIEDALRKSEETFRHMLDDSPLGVRISTIEGKTLYANRAILDIYGYDNVEELENTPLKNRYTPETYAEFQERKKKRLRGETGPSEYEVSIVRKNGEIGHLYVFRKEIYWNGKKQSQVIYQDITLRRQAEDKLSQLLENLRQSIRITIQVLGTASEARDPYMAGHQKRVADLARAIATEMKLPHDKIEAIRMAGAIHDIGKISVPSEILCKPAILSDLEFSFIKNHPQYSYDIIKEVESPWPLADIVHQHHERLDGSGYPQGLKNDDILIESRVIAVADVVEAMISYRPYRPALDLEIALGEIEKNAGILYDPKATAACLKLFREKGYKIAS